MFGKKCYGCGRFRLGTIRVYYASLVFMGGFMCVRFVTVRYGCKIFFVVSALPIVVISGRGELWLAWESKKFCSFFHKKLSVVVMGTDGEIFI